MTPPRRTICSTSITVPCRLQGLVITAPDGSAVTPENTSTGKYRSTFDVPLKNKGTYRIALVSDGLFARYKENGEQKRWRGKAENLAKEIPATATDVVVTQSQRRLETFVSVGNPDEAALKPTGAGPRTGARDASERSRRQ